jgi:hypothetical protein
MIERERYAPRAVLASVEARLLNVDRRDWLNYRVVCPSCGEVVGPRNAIREHLDVPPDPPYAVIARCPRRHLVYVEFASPV